ncbi:MAG: TIGR00303 family protein [Candidatus Bathyarchaeia archaeon]
MRKKKLDIIPFYEETRGKEFLAKIEGKNPLFICVIGTTETAKIPGLSAAGKNPDLTDYTPPADVELLLLGSCKCIKGVPVTPEGIPTPALITMSALKLANMPALVVSGGVKVNPHIPFIDLGGKPGGDIRTGRAVENVEEVLERAKIAGENLSKMADYLVIGESVPGGTTTTMGVLLAMGVDARGKVSSSMPSNPHELKTKTVEAGLKAANIEFGSLKDDPLRAISCVGDPMMPAFAGLVLGAAHRIPVLMAGGTQMSAVLAVIKALRKDVLNNLAIGTTRWIISDKTADLKGIIAQIAKVPILAADLDFSRSRFTGLRAYEAGVVKEGVGAGGSAIAAMAKSKGLISKDTLLEEIEKNYERLVASK